MARYLEPLSLASQVKSDPSLPFLCAHGPDRLLLPVHVPGNLVEVEPRHGLERVEETRRVHGTTQMPAGHESRYDHASWQLRRWKHYREVQCDSASTFAARHRPDGVACNIARIHESDEQPFGSLFGSHEV